MIPRWHRHALYSDIYPQAAYYLVPVSEVSDHTGKSETRPGSSFVYRSAGGRKGLLSPTFSDPMKCDGTVEYFPPCFIPPAKTSP
jgi:hypothetical protein